MKRWQELVHVSSMLRLLKLRFTSVLFCYQRWQVLCCGRNLFFYFILYAQLHNSHATSALNIAPYCNTRLRRKPARHTQYEPNKIELNIEMDPIYHKLSVLTQSANIIYYDAHIFIYAVRSEKNLERWKAKNRKSVNLHFHATTQLTNNRRKCLPII